MDGASPQPLSPDVDRHVVLRIRPKATRLIVGTILVLFSFGVAGVSAAILAGNLGGLLFSVLWIAVIIVPWYTDRGIFKTLDPDVIVRANGDVRFGTWFGRSWQEFNVAAISSVAATDNGVLVQFTAGRGFVIKCSQRAAHELVALIQVMQRALPHDRHD